MVRVGLAGLALAAIFAATPAASATTLSFYGQRAAFLFGAGGGISTETFNSCGSSTTDLAANQSLSHGSPGPCGSILAGFTIAPPTDGNLYIAAPGQSTNPTTALGMDFPLEGPLVITFDGAGASAFGFDLFQNFGGGAQGSGPATFTYSVFSTGGGLSIVNTRDKFVGIVASHGLIQRVEVFQQGGYAVIDNLSVRPPSGPGGVPEPAAWALMITGFGLAGRALRRRRLAA